MSTPLCMLLPVYNAQHTLEAGASEILEFVEELTARFELCILDDGSTDDTPEVARELAARYPQIRVIHHPVRLGLAETIQTGLDHSEGDMILIGDDGYTLDPDDLRTLWQLREVQRRLIDRGQSLCPPNARWLEKLLASKSPLVRRQRGFQIILRQAFEQFRLQQAAEMVRRIDANAIAGKTSHPNFLNKVRRFAADE